MTTTEGEVVVTAQDRRDTKRALFLLRHTPLSGSIVKAKHVMGPLYCLVEREGDNTVYESRSGLPCGYVGVMARWLFKKQPVQTIYMALVVLDPEQDVTVLGPGIFVARRMYLMQWHKVAEHPAFVEFLTYGLEQLEWSQVNFMMYWDLLRQNRGLLERVIRRNPHLVQCLTPQQQREQEDLMLTAVIQDPTAFEWIWEPSQLVQWAAQQLELPELP